MRGWVGWSCMTVILPPPAASRSSSSWCLPRRHVQARRSPPHAMEGVLVGARTWSASEDCPAPRVSWAFSFSLHVRCKIRRVSYPIDVTAHMQQSDQAHRREWPAALHGGGRRVIHCALPPALRLAAPAKSLAPVLIEVRISLMHV